MSLSSKEKDLIVMPNRYTEVKAHFRYEIDDNK